MASSQEKPLTQEELLNGKPNRRVFILDANNSRNSAGRKLQFFSTYSSIKVEGALPLYYTKGFGTKYQKISG